MKDRQIDKIDKNADISIDDPITVMHSCSQWAVYPVLQ